MTEVSNQRGGSRRVAAVLLSLGLLAAGAGCGSQASDREIVDALHASDATSAGVTVPDNSIQDAPNSGGAVDATPGGTTSGNAGTSAAGSSVSSTSGGGVTPSGSAARAGGGDRAAGAPVKSGVAAATKAVLKIGVSGAFSGVLGAAASPSPRTLQAWAAAQNARGGVNGHPVQVVVGDDGGDPGTALTLVRRMVESDRVVAMVGSVILFGYDQIEKYAREKNVPLIGTIGGVPGEYSSPVTFPVTAYVPDQIVAGLKSLVDQGATKIALVYCLEVSAVCQSLADEVKSSTEVGKYVTESYQVSIVAPSYTSQCLRLKSSGIEAVWLGMDTAGAARLVQDCATQNYHPKVLLLGLDATSEMPRVPALSAAIIPGASFAPVAVGLPAVDEYLRGMATYGAKIGNSGVSSYAWAAAEMFALAAKNLSDAPSPAELFPEMWKMKNVTLGGLIPPVTYVKGKGTQIKPCIFVWTVKDGQFSAPNGAKLTCSATTTLE